MSTVYCSNCNRQSVTSCKGKRYCGPCFESYKQGWNYTAFSRDTLEQIAAYLSKLCEFQREGRTALVLSPIYLLKRIRERIEEGRFVL